MPSGSKSQQKLMGQAYGLKTGKIKLSDIDAEWRDEIKKLADNMSKKNLEDFAKTKHDNLPNKIESVDEDATPANVNGMGAVSLPGNPGTQSEFATQTTGSGDAPNPPTKKAKKKFKKFQEFYTQSKQVSLTF